MPRILVADDDAIQLDLRKLLLESAGHQVSLALSPKQTLTRLSKDGVDLVVMDLRFPNPHGEADAKVGLALIREIHQTHAHTPILVLSGWPADIDEEPELKLVKRVMQKPVKPAALLDAIREALI